MISLNLISPEQQTHLKIRYLHILIKNCAGALVVLSTILAIFLAPLNDKIEDLKTSNTRRKETIISNSQTVTSKIKLLNQRIASLSQVNERYYSWSQTLNELGALAEPDIYLTEFTANNLEGNFIIKGYSPTRESLLNFKDKLTASSFFKKVNSPLTNYLQESDVTFEITGSIK
ncbi:MAG: hypothetical protein WCV73_04805 [Patescibacteria group bacterium]|jgi:hypothetical protein